MNFDTFSFRPLDPDGDDGSSSGVRSILRLGGRKKTIKNEVSFSTRASVEFTDALDDISEYEKNAYWYHFDEMQDIKRELIGVVKMMQKNDGATFSDDERCSRGLESLRSPAHTEQRNIVRDSVIASVMTEQQRQRELGLPDSDGIASASSNWSLWATDRALELGRDDAKDARAIYKTSDIPEKELQRHANNPSIVRSLLDSDEYEDFYDAGFNSNKPVKQFQQAPEKLAPPPPVVQKKQENAPFCANKFLRSLNLHDEHIPVNKAQALAGGHPHHHAISNRRNRSLLVRFNRTGSERNLSVGGDSSFNALGKRVSAAIGASSLAA